MISLEEEPCCKDMQWAIRSWALYADWIGNKISINEDAEERKFDGRGGTAPFKFCPWCAVPIPTIKKI